MKKYWRKKQNTRIFTNACHVYGIYRNFLLIIKICNYRNNIVLKKWKFNDNTTVETHKIEVLFDKITKAKRTLKRISSNVRSQKYQRSFWNIIQMN